MRIEHLGRWLVAGVVVAVIAASAFSQSQQRAQTTQLTVAKPVLSAELSEWGKAYSEALKLSNDLAGAGKTNDAERLEKDLKALDQALREYVRVSERLRHKNRAYEETMQFLAMQNNMQMQSRQFQTLSNITKVAHDVELASIRNAR